MSVHEYKFTEEDVLRLANACAQRWIRTPEVLRLFELFYQKFERVGEMSKDEVKDLQLKALEIIKRSVAG